MLQSGEGLSRRAFVQGLAGLATAALSHSPLRGEEPPSPAKGKIRLGLDNFAVRGMGWKAPALIEYAASLKLDSLFISDLDAFESLEDADLKKVRAQAEDAGLALHV